MDELSEEEALRVLSEDARRIAARVPEMPAYGRDDAHADALLGALLAIRTFCLSKGATLRTYAQHRMRGAVIDGMRRMDYMTRKQRAQAPAGGAPVPLPEDPPIVAPDDPAHVVEEADLMRRTRHAIEALPPREKHVVIKSLAGEPLHAIGAELGVSESMAARIRKRGAALLRTRLDLKDDRP